MGLPGMVYFYQEVCPKASDLGKTHALIYTGYRWVVVTRKLEEKIKVILLIIEKKHVDKVGERWGIITS